MYFYIIEDYLTEKEIIETIINENDSEDIVHTINEIQIPIRTKISFEEMEIQYQKETDCYIGQENQNIEEDISSISQINYYPDGTLITPEIYNYITEYYYNDDNEGTVGGNDNEDHSIDPLPIGMTGTFFTGFTTYTHLIDSVEANSSYITSIPLIKNNYKLMGVAGYTIVNTSNLIPFRLYVEDDVLYIGIKNISSNIITDKTINITLIWCKIFENNNSFDEEGEENNE